MPSNLLAPFKIMWLCDISTWSVPDDGFFTNVLNLVSTFFQKCTKFDIYIFFRSVLNLIFTFLVYLLVHVPVISSTFFGCRPSMVVGFHWPSLYVIMIIDGFSLCNECYTTRKKNYSYTDGEWKITLGRLQINQKYILLICVVLFERFIIVWTLNVLQYCRELERFAILCEL